MYTKCIDPDWLDWVENFGTYHLLTYIEKLAYISFVAIRIQENHIKFIFTCLFFSEYSGPRNVHTRREWHPQGRMAIQLDELCPRQIRTRSLLLPSRVYLYLHVRWSVLPSACHLPGNAGSLGR